MKKIIAVLSNPIQFTPGYPSVLIPFSIVQPPMQNLQAAATTQDDLAPDDGNWGDEECRAVVRAQLEQEYSEIGATVEVLFAPEWQERENTRRLEEQNRLKALQDAAAGPA